MNHNPLSPHATRLTDHAAMLIQQGKIEEAQTLLRKALQLAPGHERATTLLRDLESSHDHRPKLSVIIPTCNRSLILQRCLAHLAAQSLPSHFFEVIVVDDASEDDTPQVLPTLSLPFTLRYWRQPERRGPAQARNVGIRMALGDIVVFINDDALLHQDALQIHWKAHESLPDINFSLLGSFQFPQEWQRNPWTYVLSHSDIVFDYISLQTGGMYWGNFYYTCNISTPRRAIIAAGLFDEDFTGELWGAEDIELGIRLQKIGCPVTFHEGCQAVHWHDLTVDDFARMFRVRAGGAVRMFAKHPDIPVHYRAIQHEHANFWRHLPQKVGDAVGRITDLIRTIATYTPAPQTHDIVLQERTLGHHLVACHNLWRLRSQDIINLANPLERQLTNLLQRLEHHTVSLQEAAQELFPSAVFLRWFHDTCGVCASQEIDQIIAHASRRLPQGHPSTPPRPSIPLPEPSMPRVLIACDFFWPSVGGTELFVEELGVQLLKAGYAVFVACRHLPQRTRLHHRGISILPFDCRDRFFDPSMGTEISQFQHTVTSGGFTAIIALAHPDAWLFHALAQIPQSKRPTLIMMPSINANNLQEWTTRGVLHVIRSILEKANFLVTVSERGCDIQTMQQWGLPFVFIPHSVPDKASPYSMREYLGIGKSTRVLACVGNFWPVKNQLQLIHTMKASPGHWLLVFAGAALPWPNERNYFWECWKEAQTDPRIRILGPLPPLEAAGLIRDADLLLIPSLGESAGPMVALQAMAFGTPWIATPQCNGAPDQAGGLVVPLPQFPAAVQELLHREDLTNALGTLGREHWQRCFRWESTLPLFLDLLQGRHPSATLRMPEDLRSAMQSIMQQTSITPTP